MRLVLVLPMILGFTTAANAGMAVNFDWGPTKTCFDSKSPPIRLSGVPEGTASLDIRMVDRNAVTFQHGGGKLPYKGQAKLPYGAFRYKGPCPPSPHTYRFTVKALDAGGKTLATATAERRFP